MSRNLAVALTVSGDNKTDHKWAWSLHSFCTHEKMAFVFHSFFFFAFFGGGIVCMAYDGHRHLGTYTRSAIFSWACALQQDYPVGIRCSSVSACEKMKNMNKTLKLQSYNR